MKIKYLSFLVITSLLLSCVSSNNSASSFATNSKLNEACREDLNAVVWQQTAAEYRALCYQAFNSGRYQLETLKDNKEFTGIPTIVMDLDETVLDNSPYNAQLIIEDKNYSSGSWNTWVEKKEATAVPGSIEFCKYALELDFNIIFISNRDQETLDWTVENLNRLGFDFNEKNFYLKQGDSEKSERRKAVNKSYEVIMYVGDNLADFNNELDQRELTISDRNELVDTFSNRFGIKYIVLPNAMYGNWQKAIDMDNPKGNYKNALRGY